MRSIAEHEMHVAASRQRLEVSGVDDSSHRAHIFDRLVGMITEGDLLRRAKTATRRRAARWIELFVSSGRLVAEYAHSHGREVSELMMIDPVSVTEEAPLEEVVTQMEKRRIKRVPVMRGDQVIGIVSRAFSTRSRVRRCDAYPAEPTEVFYGDVDHLVGLLS